MKKILIAMLLVFGMVGIFDDSGNRVGFFKEKKVGNKTYIYLYDKSYKRTTTYRIHKKHDKIVVDKFNPVKKHGDEYVR